MAMIKVKMTQTAFIGMRRVYAGDVLTIDSEKTKFSEKSMVKLDKDGKEVAEKAAKKEAPKKAEAKKEDKPVI